MPPTLDLLTTRLDRGGHKSAQEGMCVMEMASLLAGESWSDRPACVSPVIAAFLRRWNDDLGDEDRQTLRPYARKLIGTNTGPADDSRRAWMLADWMVRTYLPAWLRLARLDEQARAVESLPELLNAECWESARAAVQDARDAARDAAWDVTRDVARDAAWDAAWDAARDAARDVTWAVARDAAWDAARDAAWDAARDAAWDAAWDAAREELKPTVTALQESARQLLDRMIALGGPSHG